MSSFVVALPEAMSTASADLSKIALTLQQANAAAMGSTTQVAAAAQDEVSAAIVELFGNYGQDFQALSMQAAAFHAEFMQALNSSGFTYAAAEAANASPLAALVSPLAAINSPLGAFGSP